MELLQNRRYGVWEIASKYDRTNYFHEIKTNIESIIEVCQEGDVSVYEAKDVILEEMFCCFDYQGELWKELDDLEKKIKEAMEKQAASRNLLGDQMHMQEALQEMDDYNDFLNEAQDELDEIEMSQSSVDYRKKRKAKIKQQIIKNGLILPLKKTVNTSEQASKITLTEHSMNYLIANFPELTKDYPLLIDKGFLKDTNKGPRWSKSKQSLAEYFKSIQPSGMKRIPWSMIGNIFGEKNLKNSASTNGNIYKGSSKDFEEWLEIKKASVDK